MMVFTSEMVWVTHQASSVRDDSKKATLHRWKKGRLENSAR